MPRFKGHSSPEAKAKFEAKRDEHAEGRSLAYLADAVEAYGLDHVAQLAGVAGSLIAAALKDQKIGPLKGPIMAQVRTSTQTKVSKLRAQRQGAALALAGNAPAPAVDPKPTPTTGTPRPAAGTMAATLESEVFRVLRKQTKGVYLAAKPLADAVGFPVQALTPILALMVQRGVLEATSGEHGGWRVPLPKVERRGPPAPGQDNGKHAVELKALKDVVTAMGDGLDDRDRAMGKRLTSIEAKLDAILKAVGPMTPTTPSPQVPK
jgi:hypothetical protein